MALWRRFWLWGGHAWALNGAFIFVATRSTGIHELEGFLAALGCGLVAIYMWRQASP